MNAAPSEIRVIIDRLVEERQLLRRNGGDAATLNANRAALVYWQLQLTRAHATHALSASG